MSSPPTAYTTTQNENKNGLQKKAISILQYEYHNQCVRLNG